MDAIYVVDEEFQNFSISWAHLWKLIPLVGATKQVKVEPLRITVSQKNSPLQFHDVGPQSVGYHFTAQIDKTTVQDFIDQSKTLVEKAIPFQVRSSAEGVPLNPEVRFEPPQPIHFIFPVEDELKAFHLLPEK